MSSDARPGRRLPVGARVFAVGACAILATASVWVPVSADADDEALPVNAVSSTGGVATAEANTSVQTGDIITGMNTGHSVETGGTSQGDLIVTVAEMSSESNLEVVAEVGPQIADASGGDDGLAEVTPGDPPDIDIDVDSKNNNRSSATGIGEGGAGGSGGTGGDVTVSPAAP